MKNLLLRIGRLIMSLLGFAVRSAENPELLIRQEMDNLRDKVPGFNEKVAKVKANEIALQRELADKQAKLAELEPKIVTAVKLAETSSDEGMKNAAIMLMNAKTTLLQEVATTQANFDAAKIDSTQAMEMREAFVRETHAKISEAQKLLTQVKQNQMKHEMNSVMQELQVGDSSNTLNSLKERVQQDSALEDGRAAVAATSVEAQMAKIDNAAASVQAADMYSEYKKQLGFAPAEESPRTMDPVQSSEEKSATQAVQGVR